MKSKIEIKLNEILKLKYQVKYEPKILYGKQYNLKVDFELIDTDGNIIYFEYSGMNFFKKYYKILDVAKHNSNFFVIFDDEKLNNELEKIYNKIDDLSSLTLEKTVNRIETFYTNCKLIYE